MKEVDILREEIAKIVEEILSEQEGPAPVPAQQVQQSPQERPKRMEKPKAVRFNKGLENEFTIVFSERGFLVGDTRMSFEELEHALSKEYTITTNNGTVLDAVKMQQILKYKDLF